MYVAEKDLERRQIELERLAAVRRALVDERPRRRMPSRVGLGKSLIRLGLLLAPIGRDVVSREAYLQEVGLSAE